MGDARVIPLHPGEPVQPPRGPSVVDDQPSAAPPRDRSEWERALAGGLAFLRRRITGEYEVDDFGFDPDLTEHVALPVLRPLYRRWFRTEVIGIEHVPGEGGALLVANHAGGLWALDAVMTAIQGDSTYQVLWSEPT